MQTAFACVGPVQLLRASQASFRVISRVSVWEISAV